MAPGLACRRSTIAVMGVRFFAWSDASLIQIRARCDSSRLSAWSACVANCFKACFQRFERRVLKFSSTVGVYGLPYHVAASRGGGIGRRARLRIWWRNP